MRMKKNLPIRILTALGGLSLWLMGLGVLAETFFRMPLSAWLSTQLSGHSPLAVLLALIVALLLCLFGTCCWLLLCPQRVAKRGGFVMQKGENGTIGVSVRSIEGLVQTCVKQHESVASADISIVERRDGIVILMHIQEEAGVNIPLAVGAMQKQIKQYVSACTGVDVQEVRVMVENTEPRTLTSPFAVQEGAPVAEAAPLTAEMPETSMVQNAAMAEMPEQASQSVELPQEAAPVEAICQEEPVGVMMPPMPEMPVEEDDRPLHQRLFGAEEEPAIVPAPPQMTVEPEPEVEMAEPAVEAESAEATDETESDEMDPNAVMEVIAAMSGEMDDLHAEESADDAEASVCDETSCPQDPSTQDN